jgi:hypothetical protein
MAGAAARKTKKPDAPKAELTADRLRALVAYDPETGGFWWRVNKASNARAGDPIGSAHNCGYLAVRIDGAAYLLHRLAWLHVRGVWPAEQIDHIDGDRTNNRIANLRECSNAENCQNVRAHRDGTSRFVGVSWSARCKSRPWVAMIGVSGRQKFLGYFATEEEAAQARLGAKRALHPFHPEQEVA